MPVTIHPANKPIEEFKIQKGSPKNAEEMLKASVRRQIADRCIEIFQSSFEDNIPHPSDHGFVRAVVSAYNTHHALVLRPDDVWLSILTQLNFYVNAHAEELRHLFVAHEGKKELEVKAVGNRYTVDFGAMAKQMTDLLHKNVIDPDLRSWIVPSFSTTTDNDKVVASVVMMATLQAYFSYKFTLCCGIPSVTLLGEREDWVQLLNKVDKLESLGSETSEWAKLLRPVLRRFVKTFDEKDSEEVLDFWNKVCSYSGGGSGPTYLSGWITAFCFFSEKGAGQTMKAGNSRGREEKVLILDDATYPKIDSQDVPPGYAHVPVKLDDNGQEFDTLMVAGLVGMEVKGGNTLQPASGWWIFHAGEEKKEERPW